MIVIIPSIRQINLSYIEPLIRPEVRILVVDDTDEERLTSLVPNMEILNYSYKKKRFGKLSECIPLKNGACRDLGLLVAYLDGDADEVVVCLDDDCKVDENFYEKAINSLGHKIVPYVETKKKFYNLLDLYTAVEDNIFPRGFPYEERTEDYNDYKYKKNIKGNVVFNLGLWNGVFDVNAADKLYLKAFAYNNNKLKFDNVAVQKGALVSLCSMNMIMKREVIPAIYQLPMNEPAIPGWKIDRYGDIWGGYICKRLIDKKNDLLTVGEPLIDHLKDAELLKNIRQEHYAHIVNVKFCELMDIAMQGVQKDNYLNMYQMFTENMEALLYVCPKELITYVKPTVAKMHQWVKLLDCVNQIDKKSIPAVV